MKIYCGLHFIKKNPFICELNPEVVLTYKLQGKPIFHTVVLALNRGITNHELIKRKIPYARMEKPYLRIMYPDIEELCLK